MTSAEIDATEHMKRRYQGIAPLERSVLQVLCVAGIPIAKTYVISALRKLGLRKDANGRTWDSKSIQIPLKRLAEEGLLGPDQNAYAGHPAVAREVVRDLIASGTFAGVVRAVRDAAVPLDAVGELWITLHEGNFERVEALLALHRTWAPDNHPLRIVFPRMADLETLSLWPDALVAEAMEITFAHGLVELVPTSAEYALLVRLVAGGRSDPRLRVLLAHEHVLRGAADAAAACLAGIDAPRAWAVAGALALSQGHLDLAAAKLEPAVDAMDDRPANGLIERLTRAWSVIACLRRSDFEGALSQLPDRTRGRASDWLAGVFDPLRSAVLVGASEIQSDDDGLDGLFYPWHSAGRPLGEVFRMLAAWWIDPGRAKELSGVVKKLTTRLASCGYHWFVGTLSELVSRMETGRSTGPSALLDAMQDSSPWQRSLVALERLLATPIVEPKAAPTTVSDVRVAWVVGIEHTHLVLRPVEQKHQGAGRWSKGRPIALERLHAEAGRMPHLSAADLRVVACISSETSRNAGGYPETTYWFEPLRALEALVGHPSVFLQTDPPKPAEVVEGRPALVVEEAGAEMVLRFSPRLYEGRDYIVTLEEQRRMRFVRVSRALQRLAQVVGEGVRAPLAAKERVLRLAESMKSVVAVRYGESGVAEGADELSADNVVVVRLPPLVRS